MQTAQHAHAVCDAEGGKGGKLVSQLDGGSRPCFAGGLIDAHGQGAAPRLDTASEARALGKHRSEGVVELAVCRLDHRRRTCDPCRREVGGGTACRGTRRDALGGAGRLRWAPMLQSR